VSLGGAFVRPRRAKEYSIPLGGAFPSTVEGCCTYRTRKGGKELHWGVKTRALKRAPRSALIFLTLLVSWEMEPFLGEGG